MSSRAFPSRIFVLAAMLVAAAFSLLLLLPSTSHAQGGLVTKSAIVICIDAETCTEPIEVENPVGHPFVDPCELVNEPGSEAVRVPLEVAELVLCERHDPVYDSDTTVARLDVLDSQVLRLDDRFSAAGGINFPRYETTLDIGDASVKVLTNNYVE